MRMSFLRFFIAMTVTAVFLRAPAPAQVLYGSLVGTVIDPTGASIQGARITVTSPATGQTRESQTDDSGYYSFPTLPSGTDTVSVNHPGFSQLVRHDVEVNINSRRRAQRFQPGATGQPAHAARP